MTTYLSSLLTSTSSRYNNLRRSLLSDESDGDTEADTHICRVLRAYYIENGRAFPPWLPPDPRGNNIQRSASPFGGNQSSLRQQGQPASARRGGGLSDLFDSPGEPSQPQQPMSLRQRGPAPLPGRAGPSSLAPPAATGGPGNAGGNAPLSRSSRPQPSGGRPMPSDRNPGLQSDNSGSGTLSASSSQRSTAGSTSQERLKAKLWGAARAASAREPFDKDSKG